MIVILKRYSLAILFLLLIIILMLIFTLGVERFGDKILEDANITVMPISQKVNL
ncbi:MAG: hypothetical protein QM497_06005 [Sulfurimonas sp.]